MWFCVRVEVLCASDVVLVSVRVLHCDRLGAVGVHISSERLRVSSFFFRYRRWVSYQVVRRLKVVWVVLVWCGIECGGLGRLRGGG